MRKDDSTPVEPIDPASLQSPATDSGARLSPAQRNTLLFLVFVGLASVAVLVFWLLPGVVDQQRAFGPLNREPSAPLHEPPETLSEPGGVPEALTEIPATPTEPGHTALRLHAESLLLGIIEKQDALQRHGVEQWADREYAEALANGQAGDAYFRKQDFAEAVRFYDQSANALQALLNQVDAVLDEALAQGDQALAQNQGEVAKRHFELARAIDADNLRALEGLGRAQTLGELFALLRTGCQFEAANRLQAAEQAYRQAVALDPRSGEAALALQRITDRLTEAEFSRQISRAYALLQSRQFEDARAAFHRAQELAPASGRPAQGLRRVDEVVREEKIAALEVEASHFEKQEDWALAAQSWQQLLALAPNTPQAREGAARTQRRAALFSKLDHHVQHPERLYSVDVSAEAQALLDELSTLGHSPGARLLQKAEALQAALVRARQPVMIALYSDNQTEVTIFRVGKLGRFEHQDIRLRPGQYTIIGSRPGYRDVRKTLYVTPDMKTGRLSILCEETI